MLGCCWHFAPSHTRRPRQIFAFGTDLTDINHAFKLRDTDDMLTEASRQIKDFAGGTQLGKSLAHLRVNFAKTHRQAYRGVVNQ